MYNPPKLDSILPEINRLPGVVAGFSMVNEANVSGSGSSVKGLDLGINTATGLEVTSAFRKQWLAQLGISSDSLAFARQVHGNHVLVVEKPGLYSDADGLITSTTGIALGILVADCACVLIADPENRVIGAFHAGWKGAVSEIVPKGVSLMRDKGARNFKVWISPCIGQSAFEVGEEVAVQFPDDLVNRSDYVKPHADLKGLVYRQILESGISEDNIYVDEACTYSDERFYSYRRQKGESGRMMGVIMLK